MSRKPLCAGNWKMNLARAEATALCRALRAGIGHPLGVDIVVFPSATLLQTVGAELANSPFAWGGQDVHPEARGAFTGDVAAFQLKDLGCGWVLCGHSERRRDHSEDDFQIGRKMIAAERESLRPILCVGETAEERERGDTFSVLTRQVRGALAAGARQFEIAYEPVWAIGTGAAATPEMAQDAHAFLRGELEQSCGSEVAERTRLLYGGSVKMELALPLIAQKDIDGFLVGGASLDSEQFLTIIAASARSLRDGG